MPQRPETNARDRIVFLLKTRGPQTATQLSRELGITSIAVRQHLQILQEQGLVSHTIQKGKVGRPAHLWDLAPAASRCFPDRHADLVSVLIEAIADIYGTDGVKRVIERWAEKECARIQDQTNFNGMNLAEKVRSLVESRQKMGYMAEAIHNADGTMALVENHCPVGAAAHCSDDLCHCELELFARILAPEAHVKRDEHIGQGDRRCVYLITPVPTES